jgi:energy-coupling factor transporter ATP-binding protein EcfA2
MISCAGIRHRNLNIDTLDIRPGITAVIGPNGSGKTTLLEIFAGIEIPGEGSVAIDGVSPRSCEIGWVGEIPDRNFVFSRVCEEIASPLRFRRLRCLDINRLTDRIAGQVGLSELKNAHVHHLSGGEKAWCAIAAALVISPDVLILDEVCAHLDERGLTHLREIIEDATARYVLWATHDMEVAAAADHIIFMSGGMPTCQGTPEEVFALLSKGCYYPPSWRVRR